MAIISAHVANDGFEGILFPGDGRKEKVIIVMSGSNGGIKITRQEAEFYDKQGVPSLALALFATKETAKNLDRVPMEYIEKAILWLKNAGYQKIGIDGTSKGSEAALLAASMFPDISCVIARVPSHFISEGLVADGKSKKPSGTSCWSYHGQEFPFAPYKRRTFDMLGLLKKEKELHMITFNRDKDVTPESLIQIEKIHAPILLVSSVNDTVWPSYESAQYMEKYLSEKHFPYQVKHIACQHLSHAMLTRLSPVYKLAFKAERQHPKECRTERAQLGRVLLDWINAW